MNKLLIISIIILASVSCKAQKPDMHTYSVEKWDSLLTVNASLRDSIASLNLIVIKDSVSVFIDNINIRLFDSETIMDIEKKGRYINVKTSRNE